MTSFPSNIYPIVLLALGISACNLGELINEEYDDCLEDCQQSGIVEYEYSGVKLKPYVLEGEVFNFDILDSIDLEFFRLQTEFDIAENIIQEPTRECCDIEYIYKGSIDSLALHVTNTEDGQSTNITSYFTASGQIPLQELSSSGQLSAYGTFSATPMSDAPIPVSAFFTLEIYHGTVQIFSDQSDIILFNQ